MFGTLDLAAAGIIVTVISAVSTLTWWLSGQFSTLKNVVFEKLGLTEKVILDKIEYHERHDDSRFAQIREELSELRIRNATKDAMMATIVTRLDKMNKS